jgi:5-methylcytosine-specific restriction endonuclease McrA
MAKNKENQKRLAKEWYERNKELAKDRARQWALANPEKRHAIHRKNREANLEKHNAYNRKWFAANPDKRAALEAKRRSAQLQRTPPWLTAEHLTQIADFYTMAKMFQMYTGETYHVDHIEPLQGDNVSGLHVPWNLQILHYKENLQKSNKTPI